MLPSQFSGFYYDEDDGWEKERRSLWMKNKHGPIWFASGMNSYICTIGVSVKSVGRETVRLFFPQNSIHLSCDMDEKRLSSLYFLNFGFFPKNQTATQLTGLKKIYGIFTLSTKIPLVKLFSFFWINARKAEKSHLDLLPVWRRHVYSCW